MIGRPAGRIGRYSGSAALTSRNLVWTPQKLLDYFINPARFASGTSMTNVNTPEAEARAIVDFLKSMDAQRPATDEHYSHSRKQAE